jgi:hypothetical protein
MVSHTFSYAYFFNVLASTNVQDNDVLQHPHKQLYRTAFHYQPAKNWMNGKPTCSVALRDDVNYAPLIFNLLTNFSACQKLLKVICVWYVACGMWVVEFGIASDLQTLMVSFQTPPEPNAPAFCLALNLYPPISESAFKIFQSNSLHCHNTKWDTPNHFLVWPHGIASGVFFFSVVFCEC